MGPAVSEDQLQTDLEYVGTGQKEGAKLLIGGDKVAGNGGHFIQATVFDHVEPHMRIAQEEIFGPVIGILRASNFEDALAKANGIWPWSCRQHRHQRPAKSLPICQPHRSRRCQDQRADHRSCTTSTLWRLQKFQRQHLQRTRSIRSRILFTHKDDLRRSWVELYSWEKASNTRRSVIERLVITYLPISQLPISQLHKKCLVCPDQKSVYKFPYCVLSENLLVD